MRSISAPPVRCLQFVAVSHDWEAATAAYWPWNELRPATPRRLPTHAGKCSRRCGPGESRPFSRSAQAQVGFEQNRILDMGEPWLKPPL